MAGVTTRPPRADRGPVARDVDTLPRHDADQPHARRTAVLGILGSLVLLVGVPVGLVALVGNPLPTEAPSSAWLTADLTATLLINVLAVLVWVVWVHFVVCFLTEWRALRAGRMPSRVVLGGGSQTLARQLVASILLLSGGASIASGVSAITAPATETPTSAAPAVVQTVEPQVVLQATDETAAPERTKHYEVRPPVGRNHDTLWDIADRTLGDPLRWKEIYALNMDRMQADGRRLTDADLIMPGWQLRLPADAKGAGVQATRVSTPVAAPATGGPTLDGGGSESSPQAGAATDHVADVADVAGPAERTESQAAEAGDGLGGIGALALGGGLVLAGILRALTARRGPFGEPDPAAAELAAHADLRRSAFLDAALRSLAEMRGAQDQAMPEVLFAYVDDRQVVLHLGRSATPPERPWTVSEDGMSWTLFEDDLVTPAAGVPAPYPCLVNVASSHGFDLLVDLEMAPGLVALGGDAEVAREVAMSVAVELVTHAWSDRTEVVLVGFGDELADLTGSGVRHVPHLDEALADAMAEQSRVSGVAQQLGVNGVLQGRQRGAAAHYAPTLLLLSGPPTAEQAQQLARLTSGGRTALAVVCVGDSASARWRFVLDAQGGLDAGVLGVRGEARRLTREGQEQVHVLLAEAVRRRTEGEALLADVPAERLPAELTSAVRRDDGSPTSAGSASEGPDLAAFDSAPVKVRLLGPVVVEAPGHVEPARVALLTEVLAMAALHPDGLHEAVLRASLWPRGVERDVVDARLADAQAWVGNDPEGRPRLLLADDGRWHLSAEVVSDAAVLARVLADEAAGHATLQAALGLGTGEVFDARYGWLAFAREARNTRLMVTALARRAAERAESLAAAEDALRAALVMVPTAEVLWRDRLRLVARHEPARVGTVVTEMYSVLEARGVRHEPETDALVAELAPELGRAAGA
jgi:hypothetical protein